MARKKAEQPEQAPADKKTAGIGRGTPGPGRPPGMPNKTTKAIKEAFIEAFDKIGGVPALVAWGEENQTEFYKLAARLIPTETHVTGQFKLEDASDADLNDALARLAAEAGVSLAIGGKVPPQAH